MDNQRVIELIVSSTKEVFSMMLGMEIEESTPYEEEGTTESFDGLVALVGIGGSWTGMGTVYCGTELALKLTGTMFMTEQTVVSDEVLDAMAEMANMIVGNVKTALEGDLGPLVLSIPTVIFGRNYKALNGMGKARVVVPFQVEGHNFDVKFVLVKQDEKSGRVSGMLQQMA
jgi:chemotaxis protein CheX